jgi:hypothetical protein
VEASAAPVPVRLPQTASNGAAVAPAEPEPPPAEAVDEGALEPIVVSSRYRVSAKTLVALATVTGVAAIALGAWAFVSSVREPDSLEVLRTTPISGSSQAISLLSKPSTQRLPLRRSGGAITLAVAADGRGVLVLDGLPVLPVGLTYQAWLLDPGKRSREYVPAAAFTGAETAVPLAAEVPRGWVVGVTAERSAGARKPTHAFRFGVQRPSG